MTNSDTTKKQRKRFKPKKADKPLQKREKKPRPIKRPVKCGTRHKTVCEAHGLPCAIEVDWPESDDRHRFKKELLKLGAPAHDEDSDHRCVECMKERLIDSPHKHLDVAGLNEAQLRRINSGGGMTIPSSSNQRQALKPPKDTR